MTRFGPVTLMLALAFAPPALAAPPLRPPIGNPSLAALRLEVLDDTTRVQEIRLEDGSRFRGHIAGLTPDSVRFVTLTGHRFAFPREDVAAASVERGRLVDGAFHPDDGADSRLLLGPTARVPAAGHGYAGVYELFFPSAGVAVIDRLMVSVGASLFPGVDAGEQIVFFSPKVQFLRSGNVSAALGTVTITATGDDATAGYAVVTVENDRGAVTGGLFRPFVRLDDDDFGEALLFGGIEARVAPGTKCIVEAWIPDRAEGALVLAGARLLFAGYSAELSWAFAGDTGFPLLSFTANW